MDFIAGLRKTLGIIYYIWVVADRLTKSAYYIPVRKNYYVEHLAKV